MATVSVAAVLTLLLACLSAGLASSLDIGNARAPGHTVPKEELPSTGPDPTPSIGNRAIPQPGVLPQPSLTSLAQCSWQPVDSSLTSTILTSTWVCKAPAPGEQVVASVNATDYCIDSPPYSTAVEADANDWHTSTETVNQTASPKQLACTSATTANGFPDLGGHADTHIQDDDDACSLLPAALETSPADAGKTLWRSIATAFRWVLDRSRFTSITPAAAAASPPLPSTPSPPLPPSPHAYLVAQLAMVLQRQLQLHSSTCPVAAVTLNDWATVARQCPTFTAPAMALHRQCPHSLGILQWPVVLPAALRSKTDYAAGSPAVIWAPASAAACSASPLPHCHNTYSRARTLLQELLQLHAQQQPVCSPYAPAAGSNMSAGCTWVQVYNAPVEYCPWQPRSQPGCKLALSHTEDVGQSYLRPYFTDVMRRVYSRGLPAATNRKRGKWHSCTTVLCNVAAWLGSLAWMSKVLGAWASDSVISGLCWLLVASAAVCSTLAALVYIAAGCCKWAMQGSRKSSAAARERRARLAIRKAKQEAKLAVLEGKVAAAKAASAHANAALEDLQVQAAKCQKEITELQTLLASRNEEVISLTGQLAAIQEKVNEFRNKHEAATHKVQELENELADKASAVNELTQQLQEADHLATSTQDECDVLKQRVVQLQCQLQAAEEKEASARQANLQLQAGSSVMQQQLKAALALVSRLREEAAETESAKEAQQAHMSALQEQLLGLQQQLQTTQDTLAATQEDVGVAQGKQAALESELAQAKEAHHAEVAELHKKLNDAESTNASLLAHKAAAEESLASMKQQLSSTREEKATLEQALCKARTQAQADNAAAARQLAGVQASKELLENQLQSLENMFQVGNGKLAEAAGGMSRLQKAVSRKMKEFEKALDVAEKFKHQCTAAQDGAERACRQRDAALADAAYWQARCEEAEAAEASLKTELIVLKQQGQYDQYDSDYGYPDYCGNKKPRAPRADKRHVNQADASDAYGGQQRHAPQHNKWNNKKH